MTPQHVSPLDGIPTERGREIAITLLELLEQHRSALVSLMHIAHHRMDAIRLSQEDYSLLQRYGALEHDGTMPDDVAAIVRECVRFEHGGISVIESFLPPAWKIRARR